MEMASKLIECETLLLQCSTVIMLSFRFFLNAGVKKDRVANIAKHWFEHGVSMPENLGGARNVDTNAKKREHVKEHIETFTCCASHYARRGAPGRKYLPTDLSVKKMH